MYKFDAFLTYDSHSEAAGIILVPVFQRQYRLMVPPSTLKSNPVIISASLEARKTAPLA